ncbi:GL26206 [Drosophila persimilis]|uniref:GL26206 n=2 Tax=Drosophila persimilis TaxID=7234 RepID=B4GJ24_DROPE|nr:uncharacterized protein LOC6593552 isoform X1 [Drosophila persimilis]EDW37338.1 GL26206 [Drosophila persimilis]
MSIVRLNDDCLLKIIEYLDFDDQLELWQATDDTTRLCLAVAYSWHRMPQTCLYRETFEGRLHALDGFLESMKGTMKHLTITYLPGDQMERFSKLVFPNMRVLDYMADETDDWDEDSDIKIIVNCFPHLESLKLTGMSKGNDIYQMRNIRHLDIAQCWNLSVACIENVCEHLRLRVLCVQWRRSEEKAYVGAISKLNELEELEVEVVQQESIPQLMRLPKLRKLRIITNHECELVRDIAVLRGKDIISASFNDSIWLWTTKTWTPCRNLRNLTIINDEGCSWVKFRRVILCFPLLEQVHLENSRIFDTADELWDLVSICPHLKRLAMSHCILYNVFFKFDAARMGAVLDKRTQPLLLQCFKTSADDLVLQLFKHPKLKIFFEALEYSPVAPEAIELEFLPLEA